MYKFIAALAFVLLTVGSASAQSHIASFKFEDAEVAFAAKDYKKTLKHLSDAEAALGRVNPPILHLRILALNELLHAGMPDYDFDLLAQLNAGCEQFLREFGGIQAVREKAREVYTIAEKIKPYPKTQAKRDAVREAAARKAAAKRAEEARQARLKEIEALPTYARVDGLEALPDYKFTQYQGEAFNLKYWYESKHGTTDNRVYCSEKDGCLYENEFISKYQSRVGNDLDEYYGHRNLARSGTGFAISTGAIALGTVILVNTNTASDMDAGEFALVTLSAVSFGVAVPLFIVSIVDLFRYDDGPPEIPRGDAYRHIERYNENLLRQIDGRSAQKDTHPPTLTDATNSGSAPRISAAPFLSSKSGGVLVSLDF